MAKEVDRHRKFYTGLVEVTMPNRNPRLRYPLRRIQYIHEYWGDMGTYLLSTEEYRGRVRRRVLDLIDREDKDVSENETVEQYKEGRRDYAANELRLKIDRYIKDMK